VRSRRRAREINSRIQKFANTGTFLTAWGSPQNGDGQLDLPGAIALYGVAVDGNGDVFVSDTFNHRIQKFACP
jgi:hypothetical protein